MSNRGLLRLGQGCGFPSCREARCVLSELSRWPPRCHGSGSTTHVKALVCGKPPGIDADCELAPAILGFRCRFSDDPPSKPGGTLRRSSPAVARRLVMALGFVALVGGCSSAAAPTTTTVP